MQPYTQTKDGQAVLINTPAYTPDDVERAAESGADGLGLLSTDFMYLDRNNLPGEEELYETFCRISRKMGGRPVTIRLMQLPPSRITAIKDAGLSDEYRGVRLGLARPDMLLPQLRAFMRAGAAGNLRLLLPVVADVSEVLRIKEMINDIHHELAGQNIPHVAMPELGVEVEIPAAAVMAPVLAFEVAFFSISEKLIYNTLLLNNSHNLNGGLLHDYTPSFLFQISHLAEEVRKRRKTVSVTAPLAGRMPAVPLLVAIGANELVMAPEQIEQAREIVSRLTMPRAKLVASKAMSFWSPNEIQRYAEECLARLLK
ncbi:phosphotransferase system, enzyme I, PtsI [Desulfoscipio geothermicus DSM 3669]|uniref:Phosphotransferase system, enzyme I, PtsI n=2 Tax=Desulfoscipio geothermicus TaxID=39060 RepID=A0A1I6DSI4_9FIRM|nr:phosphotransferase system, enzyme I, PtsI [Desulfoscipio geothermicus DSM 3669]